MRESVLNDAALKKHPQRDSIVVALLLFLLCGGFDPATSDILHRNPHPENPMPGNASAPDDTLLPAEYPLPGGVEPVPPGERRVGVAYTLWMDEAHWANTWGTPLLGRYDSRDRSIIRQHAEWLADAGVDFIWIDWSNQIQYDPEKEWNGGRQDLIEEATAILFEEYAMLERRPKISIFIGVTGAPEAVKDGRLQKKADQVYDMYAGNPRYRDLWQAYLDKPLLVVYLNTPAPLPYNKTAPTWDDPRFTVRWMTGFITQQPSLVTNERVSRLGYWSWEDRGAQTYPVHDGRPEAMVICAATRAQRAKDKLNFVPARGRRNGESFREQWARARKIGPRFGMVVSWNEWTKGEQPSAEVSKDLEPSIEFGRFYLDLLKEEIARFKDLGS